MKARIALLLLLAASAAAQAEIYQWQDEKGRQYFGEEVPARYQKKAKPVQSGPLNLMKAQKVEPSRTPAAAGPATASTGAPPPTTPSATGTSDEERCRVAQQRYLDSQACFARFRLSNGAVRPEAFEQCQDIAAPQGCGLNR